MAEWTQDVARRGPSAGIAVAGDARALLGPLLAGWPTVIATSGLAVALALAWLNLTVPLHTATMVLGPTARTGIAAMGARMPLTGVDAAGLAEPGNGEETLSDFARFLELLGAPAVAERLMADPEVARRLFPARWDAGAGRWRPPAGAVPAARRWLLALAGRSDWVEPDPVVVARHLQGLVTVDRIDGGPMRRVALRHEDRAFALDLLHRLAAAADAQLRAEAARRSAAQIAYLERRTAGVTNLDQRSALNGLKAEQERVLLLVEIGLPFAADPIAPPSAARLPDWPDPLLVLTAALSAGVALGVLTVNLRAAFARPGRQDGGPGGS
ncbi:hypothetical protein [Azospirillum sp. ST 5-10]|uniref:hypothetical protein n=1 Tax=unclassified Azospirillum TaxID=2630922 RepID=UPI003F49DDBD